MSNEKYFKFIILLLVILSLYSSINIILNNVDHNEYMYVTAGVLLKNNNVIYKDFAFLQTPLLPIIYALIFKLIPSTNYLLIAKIISFLFLVFSALIIKKISFVLIKDKIFSYLISIIFILNPVILRISIESSNYISSLFFFILSIYFLIKGYKQDFYNPNNYFFSALFLGLSISTKLFYMIFLLPYLIFLLVSENKKQNILKSIKGLFIGLLPIFVFLIISPDKFIFYNIKYHILNSKLMAVKNQFGVKLELFKRVFIQTDILSLAFFIIFLIIINKIKNKYRKRDFPILILIYSYLLFSFLLILLISPVYIQYFSSFVLLLFVLVPIMINISENKGKVFDENNLKKISKYVFSILLVFMLIINYRSVFKKPNFNNCKVNKIFKISKILKKEISKISKENKNKVFCFIPILPLQAGQEIYNELATGGFMYRISKFLTFEEQKKYKTFSKKYIIKQLNALNPKFFLIGYKRYSRDIMGFIKTKNFIKSSFNFGNAGLYIIVD